MDTSKATARPWRALRWWESAGMALADASDDEERAEWARCKVVRIEGANGETVCAAHDLAEIEPDDAALIVRAVNSHDALVAALRSIPPSPVSRPVTSAEWEVADRFEGFFDAFEGTAVRSIRSAAYERGMADGKQARAALALAEQGGG